MIYSQMVNSLRIEEIPLNSYWVRCLNSNFGIYVIGFDYENKLVYVNSCEAGKLVDPADIGPLKRYDTILTLKCDEFQSRFFMVKDYDGTSKLPAVIWENN